MDTLLIALLVAPLILFVLVTLGFPARVSGGWPSNVEPAGELKFDPLLLSLFIIYAIEFAFIAGLNMVEDFNPMAGLIFACATFGGVRLLQVFGKKSVSWNDDGLTAHVAPWRRDSVTIAWRDITRVSLPPSFGPTAYDDVRRKKVDWQLARGGHRLTAELRRRRPDLFVEYDLNAKR